MGNASLLPHIPPSLSFALAGLLALPSDERTTCLVVLLMIVNSGKT